MPKTSGEAQRELANVLLRATTEDDVADIVRLAESIGGPLRMRPVGDRPNNIGTIGLGSDPALGLVERITNAMDAVLDLGHFMHNCDRPASPRDAARRWFGVPSSGLADMSEADRRRLGEAIRVVLEESGVAKRPTVVVEDRGIGQSPADFPRTLLSLNEQNKVNQPWNMGTYGQGGSVTYQASLATIILSRRHPKYLGGDQDAVGWTVVLRHMDPHSQALPSYQYLVAEDNSVLHLPTAHFPELLHGTRVTHIGYDLQGWAGPFTTGLWQFLHSAVFDPVLPFLITGRRESERRYGSRIVVGNATRLERPEKARGDLEIAHKDSLRCDLGPKLGHVTFNYWVVRRPIESGAKSDPIAGYTRAEAAVSITLFGQRQDTESRTWIKDNAKYPFLYKNMIVQVDADGLTPYAKGEIFASTRERARQGDLRGLIYSRLAEVLRGDDELRRLHHEEKERLLSRSATAASEKVRKRLADFIKTKLKEQRRIAGGGTEQGQPGSRKGRSGKPTPPRDIDDSALPNVPSRLQFASRRIRVYQGARSHVWVEVNAKNGYLPSHDEDLKMHWSSAGSSADKVRVAMQSTLLGGRSRWYIEADPDAEIGEYVLQAELLTANGTLSDRLTVVVAPPLPAIGVSKGTEPETGPRVEWVSRDDWEDHAGRLDARAVGYVTEDEEETIIWVNRHLDLLEKALAPRSLTPEAIETRATRYQYPIACALWLQEQAAKTADPRPSEAYQRDEQRRMAEAVLVAIDPDVAVAEVLSEE